MKPTTSDITGHSNICTVGVSQHYSLSKYKDEVLQHLNIGITDESEVQLLHYTTFNRQLNSLPISAQIFLRKIIQPQ